MAESNPDYKTAKSIYEFSVKNIKGETVKLDVYKGHVCIIVNVASQCGLTANNYKQFNELFEEYGESKGCSWFSAVYLSFYPVRDFRLLNHMPHQFSGLIYFMPTRLKGNDFF